MSRLEQFFSTDFLAPHGYCFLWLPEIVWIHVVADTLIALSYFSIPLALALFLKRRPDMPFRLIFALFASFITLCGLTHVAGIAVLWYPAYGLEGVLMLITGLVSALTALVVWRMLPMMVKLPSPAQYQAMNEELKTAYAEVEQKVIERTRELVRLNHELNAEKEKLANANEAKKLFVANISHEIRTPLNAIVVLAEKFHARTMPADKHDEAMESLYNSSVMLKQLIHDILDFSKIESHAMELVAKPFSLHSTIDHIKAIAKVQAGEKGLFFLVQGGTENLPRLQGDAVRIKQILLNLITNAIKFTEHGGVTLVVNADIQGQNAALTLAVKDTGVGIHADSKQKIFEQFVQATQETSQQYGGTGLGLAISKQLVEKMGGSLELESSPGEGSLFTVRITLPLAMHPSETGANPGLQRQVVAAPAAAGDCRILVVEDNPGNILVARILLQEMGYAFDIATNGKEAVEMFLSKPFHLILMDLRLPDMTGYDITNQIRTVEKNAGRPMTPIIAMTAFATHDEKQRCYQSGMNGFTTKPIDIAELQALLQEWLGTDGC